MVDLTAQPGPLVTSQAPTPGVSPGQVAEPYKELARSMDQAGEALTAISVPLAERQASEDLLKQKVTLNADGSVNVENPASAPLMFGAAGNAYHDAVAKGTVAQWGNVLSQRMSQLHADHATDPNGFKVASDAFLDGVGAGTPPKVQEAIQTEGAQLQTRHFDDITNKAASINVEAQKQSILSQIEDQKNTLIGLVRQSGDNTPEFKQAAAKLNSAYDALGGNPLFKTPQDQIDLEKKNTQALLHGEAVVSGVDDNFNKRGKAAAQKLLEDNVLANPSLREADRTRLYAQGMSRLQFLSGDAKATLDANHQIVTEMEKGLADGKLSADDSSVGMAITRAQSIGDVEGVQRLTAAAAVQQHLRGVNQLNGPERDHILGTGGYEPINQAVPPEGRALLKAIGSTESGNRYDVRYTGTGGAHFQGYADHPRVSEPITSGPDAGNTSSAAGYYQLIAPTWDAEKQKLGLKDFSPANQDAAAWDLAQSTYKDKTGKDLLTTLKSGNTADVLPALSGQWSSLPGGRQPAGHAMAPSANGGPNFTAADVQRNPFLLSAYVRSLAADPELRVQSAKSAAAAISKTIDNGFAPSADAVAQVNQAAQLFPEKMGAIADEMNGKIKGQLLAQLPADQREAVEAQFKAATAGPDVHQVNIASAALGQVQAQETNLHEHPMIEAANRGWITPQPAIDPEKPDTIAAALASRAAASKRIGAINQTPNPPMLDKDDMPKLQSVLQGQNGAQVLGSIAQSLKPDEMQTLLKEEAFRTSITGMSRSGDPAKMNAAYSFMDAQQKQNPLQFDKQFPDELKDLRAWQGNLAFYPPDVAAKRLMAAYDPSQSSAIEAADKVADKALTTMSADKIVSKFSTGFGPFGTGARAPVTAMAGIAAGALKADYDKNFKDGYAATGDGNAADAFAMEKLNLKYAVSATNGNRVMPYAPERYYPEVGGSHDWMSKQLDDEVAKHLGANKTFDVAEGLAGMTEVPDSRMLMDDRTVGEREYGARRAIVSDDTTERDIAGGRPPSYQVVIQDPNGRWNVMSGADGTTQRFRFDPTAPFAERAAGAESVRPTVQMLGDPLNQQGGGT